ncbi:MAG TPA: sporulation integral membrane protein YtvI, partial [Clostridiales bacterium]|nr:sporulation integral membrane protein YtvI [Clostridiales bacterium]
NAAVRRLLPEKIARRLIRFKDGFLYTMVRYLRSYLLIMAMTFVIMLVGFLLLRIPYALLAAIAVALLDMLPVIGVGTVLVPWSVFSLISGNTPLAVGLFLLFAANEIIRQFAEPKIVGRHLGIHPLLTLIFLYVGYALFGVLGLLLIPIATVAYQAATGKGKERGGTPPAAQPQK